MVTTPYSWQFYARCADASAESAARIVPHVMRLVGPRSVVDVGCGLGTWLAAFAAQGVETIMGIDGEHVDREALRIPAERFHARDLEQPLEFDCVALPRFELAMSLEVAEHLPERCAAGFVESLTRLAPIVLFSAAVPRQGGTRHLNEQWPQYWAQLFARHGFETVDCIRPFIWDDAGVAYYYAQNTLCFVETSALAERPALQRFVVPPDGGLARIHPRKWLEATDHRHRALRDVARSLPWAVRNTLARLMGRAA